MSTLVAEMIQAEIGARERWPDNVYFYQPYQVEQITFPDYAVCLGVKTFLHMCGLKFTLKLRTNAEEMSPSGKVPFLHLGPFLVSEFEPIVSHVQTRGFNLSEDLTDVQKSEMKAYISLVNSLLGNAELYLAWVDEVVSEEITKPRYGHVHPWPLNKILPWMKQREVKNRLKSVDWLDKTFDEVCEEVLTCCRALSERLDKHTFFFGEKPTELDAMVFGHLYTLITTELPNSRFAEIIQKFENLTKFVEYIDYKYYKGTDNEY